MQKQPGCIIRFAEERDVDTLVNLLSILFSLEEDFTVDPGKQQRGVRLMLASKQAVILVAEKDGTVVGMCSGQLLISTAEGAPVALVEDVVVFPEYRNTGVGSRLVAAVIGWANQHGGCRLQLLADRNNLDGLEFYHANGWQSTQLICLRKTIESEGDSHG